ncbi:two-component sensor histidine kinase [Bacteroidia bacterium]|nr:two-component sensor histidine kinase [Bacteroidia bacterium]
MVPLVLAQVIMVNVFFGNHWERVHADMARALSADISVMMAAIPQDNDLEKPEFAGMSKDFGIAVSIDKNVKRPKRNDNDSRLVGMLASDLKSKIKGPAYVYVNKTQRQVSIDIPRGNNMVTFSTSLRRVYSTSTEVFVIWLVGSILIVAILIFPFILMHTRSIHKIAKAAGNFGRGLDAPGFKPSGSREIREASRALIIMKERLNRHNRTRSDMLTAVSHDLKSPLARMRIAVETGTDEKEELLRDIDRMTEMVNGYLAFARGEVPEIEQMTALPAMLTRIVRDSGAVKKIKTNFPENPVEFYARPTSIASAFQNIISNAVRFANKKIEITETDGEEFVTVTIDDDGPGIPTERRAEAMRPFVRFDAGRGAAKLRGGAGGTGLGLSIAQTAIENHGGEIYLEDSPLGGLRVRVILPI